MPDFELSDADKDTADAHATAQRCEWMGEWAWNDAKSRFERYSAKTDTKFGIVSVKWRYIVASAGFVEAVSVAVGE